MSSANETQIKFTVRLSMEELRALSVFKPEFKYIIDEYHNRHNIYVDRVGKLLGFVGYLSEHNYKEHLSKLETLKDLIYDYFFDDCVKYFISEFEITDNLKYGIFISKLDSIYSVISDVLTDLEASEEEMKEFFSEYHTDLKDLIKI